MTQVFKKIRFYHKKNYYLYMFCNFISLLLITSYASMMFSPTVLKILPEGGDSRKQVMAIFLLACVGCVVFTIYATSLFYRMKSREMGILMALGASKKKLRNSLFKEVLLLSGVSSCLGSLCGMPFAWLIWQGFRLIIVDSNEMALSFCYQTFFLSTLFIVLVMISAFFMGIRFLRRTNIMDVVNESHKSEPIHDVKPWCGLVGILLLLGSAVIGYEVPVILIRKFHWYPPAWINILYAPVFIGLYMILLHTVVRGWFRSKKNPYKGIISRNMMKFQGKQTVNNMLVITVLIAGACFGIFYTPMLGTGVMIENKARPYDYAYHYRNDQNIPDKWAVKNLAAEYNLTLKDWKNVGFLNLGIDGNTQVEEKGGKYHYEYRKLLNEKNFLSESSFNKMTGQKVDIKQGTYAGILDDEGNGTYRVSIDTTILTNMETRKTIVTKFDHYLHFNLMATNFYVLDDTDYKIISEGINNKWSETLVYFNIDGTDNYAFANRFFNQLVDSFNSECEIPNYYSRVEKIAAKEAGTVYWGDTDEMSKLSFDNRDGTDFRMYWKFMPQFRILDRNDFLRSFAVFLMMFVFIAIICIMTAIIICYTRCITIAMNNRYVFDNLRHLGASPTYLIKEVKNQAFKVFSVPSIVGMSTMFLLYSMIMFGNDGRLTYSECMGLVVCFGMVIALALLIYFIYRYTLNKMLKMLGISK